ncbi:MAG: prenyltransferase/squalene oxidase repeat-containing protein [Planctomycetota bacterium]|jgi:hypothetical protein
MKLAVGSLIMMALVGGMVPACNPAAERVSLGEVGPTPRPISPPATDDIQSAIDRGIDYLLATQFRDGSWGSALDKPVSVLCPVPGGHRSFKAGTTALCVMALLQAGGDDPRATDSLDRAEQWLVDNLSNVRRASLDTIYNNWAHAYAIQAILRLLEQRPLSDQRRQELRDLVDLQIDMLNRFRSLNGGWGYYYQFPMQTRPPMNIATSFMTATVMLALHEAKQAGFDVPAKMTRTGMMALRHARNPDFSFEYHSYPAFKLPMANLNRRPGTLARTPACHAAMAAWSDRRTTPKIIQTGLDWFCARNGWLDVARKGHVPHHSWFKMAGYFYLYGHYYASVCIDLLPDEKQEFYRDYVAHFLLPKQEKNGSWWDFANYQYHQAYGTAFGVMALHNCLPPADRTNGDVVHGEESKEDRRKS